MKKIILLIFFLATPAFAQQSNPVQDQIEKIIGNLVVQNANLANQNTMLATQLQQAQAKIKELEAVAMPTK